jgi:hypothetical protein
VRLPLSNEAHPIDEDKQIDLPPRSQEIKRSSPDNLFVDPIEGSYVMCIAFTEPAKLSHKSVMLPGARPPKPSLKPEDKVIRRPKLNRGGGTIANLGTSNGKSFQSGYGSMNINQYERDLASKTGRGNQLYQAGTRAWGAAEPTPKRPRPANGHPAYHSNPFNRPPLPPLPPPRHRDDYPPWQQQQQQLRQSYPQHLNRFGEPSHAPPQPSYSQNRSSKHHQQQQGYGQPQEYQQEQQYNQQGHSNHQGYVQQQQGGYNNRGGYNQYQGGYLSQLSQQQQEGRGPNRPYSGPARPQQQPSCPQQQHGYSFQQHNRSAPPGPSQQSRVNPAIMNNLRSQLANTLQQHRQGRQTQK